jgi:4-amino-4-deoxy-L-arabinose transferase-like glycosyltransferase
MELKDTGFPLARLMNWSVRYGVGAAVVVALLVRIAITTALVTWNEVPWRWDDASYAEYALQILRTGRLDTHHFPVGYSLFVAFCLKLSGGSFAAVRIANVIIGSLSVIPVSKVAQSLYGRNTGIIAAWLFALYPPLAFMTTRIMSETLFIGLLMSSIYWFLRAEKSGLIRDFVVGAALFSFASIVRSNLLAMFAFIPFWQLRPNGIPLAKKVKPVFVGMIVAGAILLAPGTYFLLTKGQFIPLATNAGQTFYGANNPIADGGWVQVEDHPELLESIPHDVRKSPPAYSKAQSQLATRWILENPDKFIALLPKKFANAWIPGFQKSVTTSTSTLAAILLPLSYGLIILMGLIGRSLVRPRLRDGILLAVLITYTLLSLIIYGNPRIGLFCAPVLIIYSACCITRISRIDAILGKTRCLCDKGV